MTTPAFVPGYDKGVTFKLDGNAGAASTLFITSWSWEERVRELLTTHSGTAGLEAMIAGVLSGEGTVEANQDSANIAQTGANAVRAGAKGVITCAKGLSNPISIHVMVTRLLDRSTVDGLVTYTFTVKLDASSGTYSYAS